jgi:hypothetical protein
MSQNKDGRSDFDPNTPPDIANDYDENIQSILDLMYHRIHGTASVTNDQIEDAVQNIIRQAPVPESSSLPESAKDNNPISGEIIPPTTQPPRTTRSSSASALNQQQIIPDLEDYDDLPINGTENISDTTTKSLVSKEKNIQNKLNDKMSSNKSTSRKDDVDRSMLAEDEEEIDWSIYETIPLGKQGAQMMTIFGDGKHPLPDTVRATLNGTRRKVHCTIQDARHVHRQQTLLYRTAKDSIKAERPKDPGIYKQEWSTELLFRAGVGYDPLAYHPKCGFSIEDLHKLHPEELNAYNKWNEMHSSATEAATANGGVDDENETGDDDKEGDKIIGQTNADDSTMALGHLQERAAQFDLRTNKMEQDWYMKYSNIRQKGSFLPRQSIGRGRNNRNNIDAVWESTSRQKRKIGEHAPSGGGWVHMSASAVRFLHWIGFDPMSSILPPPNDDVTAALAFLAYDFFGRIVEKAIFLRNRQKQLDTGIEINEVAISNYELDIGEQLTEHDIDRAMNDPDIKPAPLYSSNTNDSKKSLGPQLYFGPGFEDRLEMEMEEMLWGNKQVSHDKTMSDEEIQRRQQEDEFFAQLAKPPTQDGIVALLLSNQGNDDSENNATYGYVHNDAKEPNSTTLSKRAKN